ncbi:MAG TPA: GFA family protein [Kiloniellales bacterium]|nr:GFA family protein [Kiloniellales bacterium]
MTTIEEAPRYHGSCNCGALRYEVRGELSPVVYCHCHQCRETHGHFAGYTSVRREDLRLTEERGLSWYHASDIARRGFCRHCGGSVFWDGHGKAFIEIAAGTLAGDTGLRSAAHIFVADKGDYYEITDGLPQYPQSMPKD